MRRNGKWFNEKDLLNTNTLESETYPLQQTEIFVRRKSDKYQLGEPGRTRQRSLSYLGVLCASALSVVRHWKSEPTPRAAQRF